MKYLNHLVSGQIVDTGTERAAHSLSGSPCGSASGADRIQGLTLPR